MDAAAAEELERFIERDGLFDPDELGRCRVRLATAAPPGPRLAGALARFQEQLGGASPPLPFRVDAAGIVYPRLWKVLEAVRDGLPTGEVTTRVALVERNLAELFEPLPG